MTLSRDQNTERSHSMKIGDSSSFERVEEFRYLGKTLKYLNSIQVEIKSRLKSVKAGYYSVQNRLVSTWLCLKVCNIRAVNQR